MNDLNQYRNIVHKMKLFEDPFCRIKSGEKIREYRLYDEKRQLAKKGDKIEFTKLPNKDESLTVEVENVVVFKNFYDMFSEYYDDFKGRYNSIEEIANAMYESYYSKEKEEKYGCVAIKIKKI